MKLRGQMKARWSVYRRSAPWGWWWRFRQDDYGAAGPLIAITRAQAIVSLGRFWEAIGLPKPWPPITVERANGKGR